MLHCICKTIEKLGKKEKHFSLNSNKQNLQCYDIIKRIKKNWPKAETNLFRDILVDPIHKFMENIEEKPQQKKFIIKLNEAIKIDPFLSRSL